jgi:hypothetical protein
MHIYISAAKNQVFGFTHFSTANSNNNIHIDCQVIRNNPEKLMFASQFHTNLNNSYSKDTMTTTGIRIEEGECCAPSMHPLVEYFTCFFARLYFYLYHIMNIHVMGTILTYQLSLWMPVDIKCG